MKKLALIILSIVIPLILISQPCPDSLYLTSQAQVDNFQILYPNCTEIEGNVKIGEWGTDINNLNGLSVITSIGGDLGIYYTDALTSLTALEGLTSIGGELSILANNVLINLTGLDNIDATSISKLWIYGNYSLSTCEVESVCGYIANPNGAIEIHDNWFGCNSPDEIQDSCEANAVLISERYLLESYSVSPNPFTTSTTFAYTLDKPSIVTIYIYNPQGQLIEKVEQEQSKGEQQVQWNAEGLPSGMYYFRIRAGDKVGGGKMVLMR